MRTKFFLLICLVLLPFAGKAAFVSSTLSAAIANDMITVVARGSGQSYHARGLHLKLKNRTATALQLKIDPALIFRPADTTYQDLILSGETIVAIPAKGEADIDLQSFCGKSYASAPGKHLPFTFYRQGDSIMIKTLQFINKYKLYDGLGQSAVWALTNSHDLSGVFDNSNPLVSAKLVALMAKLTGWKVPDYYKLYATNTHAGEPALATRVLKIYSVFEWKLDQEKKLTIGIYNSGGTLIQPVMDNEKFIKGTYKLTVTFEAQNIASGNYYIRLKDGDTVMKEQMIKLD